MEEESKQKLMQHLMAFLSSISTPDPEAVLLVGRWLQELSNGTPTQPVAEPGSPVSSVVAKQRKPRNPYSLSARLLKFMKTQLDGATAVEALEKMRSLHVAYASDTEKAITRLFRRQSKSYLAMEPGRWIYRKLPPKGVAA